MMKNSEKGILQTLALILVSIYSIAQSIDSEVISSFGNSVTNDNVSLSFTIGEPVITNYTNESHILLQGFQKSGINILLSGFDFQFLVLFEGPYKDGQMLTSLNQSGLLPLAQSYFMEPWNYQGTENVLEIPNSNIVDWVLIEVRDASSPEFASADRIIARKACFILSDGSFVNTDGTGLLEFPGEVSQKLYIIIRHRNHLDIMSANPLVQSDGIYIYNFTSDGFTSYGNELAQKEVEPGIWALIASDANADGQIDNQDKNDVWFQQYNETGYKQGDSNMNGYVESSDKSEYWNANSGKVSHVPD